MQTNKEIERNFNDELIARLTKLLGHNVYIMDIGVEKKLSGKFSKILIGKLISINRFANDVTMCSVEINGEELLIPLNLVFTDLTYIAYVISDTKNIFEWHSESSNLVEAITNSRVNTFYNKIKESQLNQKEG